MPETYTFKKLISEYSVEIPRIQRDYAQGRLTERATEIRKSIVKNIVSVLDDKNGQKDFNFIYGSTNSGVLIPLDGQQRLTTLLLIHIYLEGIARCNNSENIHDMDYVFSYATRKSSELFCAALIGDRAKWMNEVNDQYGIQNKIKEAEKEQDKRKRKELLDNLKLKAPSEIIRNQPWFIAQWDADPTVAGMLVMLDEIHSHYVGDYDHAVKAYRRLFDEEPICFQFQSLNNFTRTDDLFIKMNSRGLGLNDFEIFKSKLVEDFENKYECDFKLKIDKDWCDYLWKNLRSRVNDKKKETRNIDIIYQRLLKFVIPAEAAALGQNISKYANDLFERNNKTIRFAHNQYEACNVDFSDNLLERIYQDLNYVCSQETSPFSSKEFLGEDYFEVAPFSKLLLDGEQLNYQDTALLYAWLRFAVCCQDSSEMIVWIKTIYHILEDSNVDSAEGLVNAIKGIGTLLERYSNSGAGIYEWLANDEISTLTGLSDYQIQEERVKAQLRLRTDYAWEKEIECAEKDGFMKGQIGFLLESAQVAVVVTDQFALNDNGLKIQEDKLFNQFKEYKEKVTSLFNYRDFEKDILKSHLLVRALLRKGDYMIASWTKRNIANSISDRDYSWHALLNIGRKHINGRAVFKKLVDDSDFDMADIKSSLELIVSKDSSNSPLWQRTLAGEYGHRILEHSHKGFLDFQFPDGSNEPNIRVLHTSQLNGFHDELWSLLLYLELIEECGESDLINYRSVKSGQQWAGISVRLHNSDEVEEYIVSHWDNDWLLINSENKKVSSATIAISGIKDALKKYVVLGKSKQTMSLQDFLSIF